MWTDPMDELIDDLERLVPEQQHTRTQGDLIQDMRDALSHYADQVIRLVEAKSWGEPVPEQIKADYNIAGERFAEAWRALEAWPSEPHPQV